eukprot:TRINITY_DN2379_c0_g1_i1.p1 TRINITY_DN2379_c0_g1~~TRINITY_DN2379_c0_g1_i1.p1  ORF type:complete len:329 (+),score=78.55 TRINITY_DN2379_c0_g1_i1:86-988(+)
MAAPVHPESGEPGHATCMVQGCSRPDGHVTSGHRCGRCKKHGHGWHECADRHKQRALREYRRDQLPPERWCTYPRCNFHRLHDLATHWCARCDSRCEGTCPGAVAVADTVARRELRRQERSERRGRVRGDFAGALEHPDREGPAAGGLEHPGHDHRGGSGPPRGWRRGGERAAPRPGGEEGSPRRGGYERRPRSGRGPFGSLWAAAFGRGAPAASDAAPAAGGAAPADAATGGAAPADAAGPESVADLICCPNCRARVPRAGQQLYVNLQCDICMERDVTTVLQCGHPFCRDCLALLPSD